MNIIQYYIKPRLYMVEQKFWLFSDEIHRMDTAMIQDGVNSCLLVMNGDENELNWGLDISDLILHKDTSVLEYSGNFVAEIPTNEIYNMLKDYLGKLKEYENR